MKGPVRTLLLGRVNTKQTIKQKTECSHEVCFVWQGEDVRMQEIMKLAHEFLQNFCAGNQQNQALLHKHINLFLNPGVSLCKLTFVLGREKMLSWGT